MKHVLVVVIKISFLGVAFGTIAGCHGSSDPVDVATRSELIRLRRDSNSRGVVHAWRNRELQDWPHVDVRTVVTSEKQAQAAFSHAINEGKIFKFPDLDSESLSIAEPVNVEGVWFGYVAGYSSPLFLVIENGGHIVYHVDVGF